MAENENMNEFEEYNPTGCTFAHFIGWINDCFTKIWNNLNELLDNKNNNVIYGTYIGNTDASQEISLGFQPVIVEVWDGGYMQGYNYSTPTYIEGGIAFVDNPLCHPDNGNALISITEGGFKVYSVDRPSGSYTTGDLNHNAHRYRYIAYRNADKIQQQ